MNAYIGTGNAAAALANRISYAFDLTGPSYTVDTACSSSLFALRAAIDALHSGRCGMAFVAGVNLILSPFRHRYFGKIGALSPTGRCHSFDAAADGYVPGEAIVSVLLRPLEDAVAAGDPVYGVIKSCAAAHGGHTPSLTAPSVKGEARIIGEAWRRGGIDPRTLGYIEAHGTGTPLGDPIEVRALARAFEEAGARPQACVIGSAKAHVGHTEGAAGLVGLVKVLLQLRHETIPAMPGFRDLNPEVRLAEAGLRINRTPEPWPATTRPRRAGVSSFGFSGAYAHVVVEEFRANPAPPREPSRSQPQAQAVPLSAKTPEALGALARRLAGALRHAPEALVDVAYTLQAGRESLPVRTVIFARDRSDLTAGLEAVGAGRADVRSDALRSPGDEGREGREGCGGCEGVEGSCGGSCGGACGGACVEAREIGSGLADARQLAERWLQGHPIDWSALHPPEGRHVRLPGYPFAQTTHWLPPPPLPHTTAPHNGVRYEADNSALPALVNGVLPDADPATSSDPEGDPPSDEIELAEVLRRHLSELTEVPLARLSIDADVAQFGFDSIVIAELVGRIAPLVGERDPSIFFASRSVRDAARRLWQRYPALHSVALRERSHPVPARSEGPARSSEAPPAETAAAPGEATRSGPGLDPARGDVAIIGMAGRYPEADDVLAFGRNLAEGRDCIEPIPHGHPSGGKQKRWGGFVSDPLRFDYGHFNMTFRDAVVAHPEERLLLQEAWRCIESAGYDPRRWIAGPGEDVGVYIGASFHDYPALVHEATGGGAAPLPCSSQTFTYANRLSHFYGLVGPSVAVDTACSSSLYAIFDATNAIKLGLCTAALAGGVNLNLHRAKYDFLEQHNFLAADGRCRAFAEGGSGYVPGEGVGIVLLKRLDRALADGDNVLAVIKGAAAGNDGRTHGFTVPNPDAQRDTILKALRASGVSPETLSFVECHGTGTALGDPVEIAGLTEAFRRHTANEGYCAVSSVKANIGHLEAAAGVSQLTKVVLQLRTRQLYPNVQHHENLNPDIPFARSPFYVQRRLAPWAAPEGAPRRAGISSFGAGGTNVHLIVEQAPDAPAPAVAPEPYHIVPFSAASDDQLHRIVERTHEALSGDVEQLSAAPSIRDIAATLQQGAPSAATGSRSSAVIPWRACALPSATTCATPPPLPPCAVRSRRGQGRGPRPIPRAWRLREGGFRAICGRPRASG